jgi:target of rapamycin complex 2 subunit MAPKAP1
VSSFVLYQLRAAYLNEVSDGVGERLVKLDDSILNSAPFKAAGWRPNPSLIKRCYSPPIPTAVASEYFQAPRSAGLTLEDDAEDGGMLAGGGVDTRGPGPAVKRRRRREQMEEDDSSDLSDESDDDADQRAAQQIKFAKMPVRHRSGSSPIQASNLRQSPVVSSPRPAPRRGSQSALETVKERARRDTVTSSEVSSENEFDASAFHRQRDASRAQAKAVRLQSRLNSEPSLGIKRQESDLLEEEEEEDSDASDNSSAFVGSIDSASILNGVDNPLHQSPRQQIVGTPPREFTRQSTIRRSQHPALQVVGELPPPRPVSIVRPMSMVQPRSLITTALKSKKPAIPFDSFASLSGKGDPNPIMVRIYAPFSKTSSKPFEVLIRRSVHQGQSADRPVTVADLIGLSLYRYNEETIQPPLPHDKGSINWWTLRMVEEGGEVDDDFPPLERKKTLVSFTTANNRAGRARSNSKVYDDFALVPASQAEFAENQTVTPQTTEEEPMEEARDEETTPRNTPQPAPSLLAAPVESRPNPITNTTYRQATLLADTPAAPTAMPNTTRGRRKLLRVHIHSVDAAPGQMVTIDVTTDTYMEQVLDLVCKKRQLDKAAHVLKLPNSGAVVLLDREVSSIGNVTDLELYRKRFASDATSTMTGSPSSASPKLFSYSESHGAARKFKKAPIMGAHPLAKELLKQDELTNTNYKKYTVWRKQTMKIMGANERILAIDGEYVHIMPSSGGKAVLDGGGKTTTVHFSNVVGCKVSRRHPTNFKVSQSRASFFKVDGASSH